MTTSWGERFVDRQVGEAWLDLRLELAQRFEQGIAEHGMDPLDISTPTGETLTVEVDEDDGCLVVIAGDEVQAFTNVDEAAYAVACILRDDWQVIHPVFLECELVESPSIDDNPIRPTAPVLAKAASREQLQEWVVAAFNEGRNTPVKVAGGAIFWRTRGGNRVAVRVHNAGRIELVAVVARGVGFKKAHRVMDKLSRQFFALKFFLLRDNLVVSQIIVAHPFCPEQLTHALGVFVNNMDSLGWVQEKVESNRAAADRTKLEVLERQHDEVKKGLADALTALDLRAFEVERLESERDAAVDELDRLKAVLQRALGARPLPTRSPRGEVA